MSRRPDRTGRPARQARARRLTLESLEGRDLLTLFTVTTIADNGSNASPSPGSLRAAIVTLDSDKATGADSISFNIANSGVQTISLQAPLPAITHPVAIDGATEPGFYPNQTPLVVVDGSSAGAGSNGLTITNGGGGSTIRGLAIVGFLPTAGGGGGEGILLAGSAAAGSNQISDDYLGVMADGVTAKPNGSGVLIFSANNVIGGTTVLTSDLISGNENAGVLIAGTTATGNVVTGDSIGTNAAGTGALGNQFGVMVMASGNTIGGTAVGAGNVIAGNVGPTAQTGAGVILEGEATNNLIAGNAIGTNRAGTSAILPTNVFPQITYSNVYGIYLGSEGDTSLDNIVLETIGGSVAGAGNLISGNFVGITGNVASSAIQGNTIGLNRAGTAPIPNSDGLLLGASLTTIGGTTAQARNIVSGNNTVAGGSGVGIALTGDSDVIQGNFVGVSSIGLAGSGLGNVDGMDLSVTNSTIGSTTIGNSNIISGNSGNGISLGGNGNDDLFGNVIGLDISGQADGNGGSGIIVGGNSNSTATTPTPLNVTIGGTTAGQGNVIAHNGGYGVDVTAAPPGGITGVGIRGNSIFGNALLGIVTPGPNPLTPIPTTLFMNGNTKANGLETVTGVYSNTPGTTTAIDLFANGADGSGSGQGAVYLGTVSPTTNASGFAVFSMTFPVPSTPYTSFSATVTGSDGNTSEFAANFPATTGSATADLQVQTSASSLTPTVGNTVTLIESVADFGSSSASAVVLYDSLPASLVNVTVTSSIGTATVGANNVVVANLGTLAPQTYATVTITATVSQAGTVVDQPGASSTTFDPNYLNNASQQSLTVSQVSTGPSSDLAVLESASASSTTVGSPLTYTISVGNIGPNAATNATVYDSLPAGATIVGVKSSLGTPSINGSFVTLNLGTLASGAVTTITVIVTPQTAGATINQVSVSGNQFDPVKSNNFASLTTTVVAPTPIIHFYLAQTAFPAVGAVGQFQAFTMTVENFGPSPATNVFLIDNLPAFATYFSSKSSQGGLPTVANGQLRENFGTLAAGAVASLQLIVIPSAVGAITNVAGVYTPDVPSAAASYATSMVSIVAGPSVTAVNGMGNNTVLAITFNEALDPTSAINAANYQLVVLGKSATGSAKTVKIASISYNPVTQTVMILPAQAFDPTQYYKITVTSGVTDTLGRKLASSTYGAAGGSFSGIFLAGSLPQI